MRLFRTSLGCLSALAVLFAACGGKQEATTPKSTSAQVTPDKGDGTVRPITQGQLQIAHYATGDGTLGLVLDRSAPRAKVRIDGEKDITELTMEEDRFGGERRGWYLKSPDGKNVLYLSAGGNLKIFRGRDELRLNSDKAAEALPAATIAGEYKRPKSDYDKHAEALTPLSFLAKNPSFKPEDSGNVSKVGDAIAAITPDMIVHITDVGATHARWAPASEIIGNVHQGLGGTVGHGRSDDKWDKSKGGLAKFGGTLIPMQVEYGSPNRLHVWTLAGYTTDLASGTPGILWQVDGGTVVFVTFDGGRYELSINEGSVVEPGLTPQSRWPAPLQNALFDVDGVRGLAKGNAVPAQVGKDIEDADDAWFTCINDQWKKTKDDLDKVEASQISANEKWGKLGGIRKGAEVNAPKTCDPKKKALDAALTKFIEARNVERLAVLEKAKTKFK